MAGNFARNSVSVLLGAGDGSFQAPAAFAIGPNPFDVAVGNLNGDGHLDIVATNTGNKTVSVLLGKSCGA